MINLYIDERRVGDVTILDLKGRVRVGGTALALHKTIRTLINEEKTLVLLNLSGVTHVDSCGLGELIASHVTLYKKGGELKLLQVTESLRDLMTATKLIEIFDIYDSESKALTSFSEHVLMIKKPQLFFV